MHNVLVQKIPLAFSLAYSLENSEDSFGFWTFMLLKIRQVEDFKSKSEKNTIHSYCSLLLLMVLFTPNFCLFKGDCPLSLGQVFLKVFLSYLRELPLRTIESLSLREFLVSPKHFLLPYNLVTRTSTSFVTVNLFS